MSPLRREARGIFPGNKQILTPVIMATLLIIAGIVLFILGMGRKRSQREPDVPFDNPRKIRVGDKEYWV